MIARTFAHVAELETSDRVGSAGLVIRSMQVRVLPCAPFKGSLAGSPFSYKRNQSPKSIRFSTQTVQQWIPIAIALFRTMAEEGESSQFSISLPLEAIDQIERRLRPYGLYGKKRATICRNLILERLRQLFPPAADIPPTEATRDV